MAKFSTTERERHYFELFREAYGLSGHVVYADKPDVIFQDAERTIGIEITNFFLKGGDLPESEQRQRLLRQKVVELAHRSYVGQNGKRIELTFTFNVGHPISDRDRVASAIAALASSAEDSPTGQLEHELFETIPELESVWLNANEYDNAKWRISQVHSVPTMSLSALKAIINDKGRNADQYRKCDACWLLVVVDFIDAAQGQEIPRDILKDIHSPVFENILIYKPQFGEIVESRQGPGSAKQAPQAEQSV